MGVRHHHAGGLVDISQDQIGGLAPHAGQPEQFFHGSGYPAAVLLHQHPGGGHDIPRLGPEKAGGVDVRLHLGHVGAGQVFQGRVAGEEGGRDLVHPLVGTLGGQTGGEEQLVVLAVVQRAQSVGVSRLQSFHDA